MSFFKKMKERLFKSSSKLDEGLDALVDQGEEVIDEAAPAPELPSSPPPAQQVRAPAPDSDQERPAITSAQESSSSSDATPPSSQAAAAGSDAVETEADKPGFLGRALGGLAGSRTVKKRVLDDDMLEELEEVLIASDMGVETSLKVSSL